MFFYREETKCGRIRAKFNGKYSIVRNCSKYFSRPFSKIL